MLVEYVTSFKTNLEKMHGAFELNPKKYTISKSWDLRPKFYNHLSEYNLYF